MYMTQVRKVNFVEMQYNNGPPQKGVLDKEVQISFSPQSVRIQIQYSVNMRISVGAYMISLFCEYIEFIFIIIFCQARLNPSQNSQYKELSFLQQMRPLFSIGIPESLQWTTLSKEGDFPGNREGKQQYVLVDCAVPANPGPVSHSGPSACWRTSCCPSRDAPRESGPLAASHPASCPNPCRVCFLAK